MDRHQRDPNAKRSGIGKKITPDKPAGRVNVSAHSKVGKAAGSFLPLLPGESQELYLESLAATIKELGAESELEVYLAEKIFISMWWLRRYENQKRSCIIKSMVESLLGPNDQPELRVKITDSFHENRFDSPLILELLAQKGLTSQSLLQIGMRRQSDILQSLDEQVALRTKTMVTLQQSFEALVNRSVLRERLKLQNEILKRDLQAIDMKEVPLMLDTHEKSRPKSRA